LPGPSSGAISLTVTTVRDDPGRRRPSIGAVHQSAEKITLALEE